MKARGFTRFVCIGCAAVIILSAACPSAFALQGIDEAMAGIRSPEDVAQKLSREFSYAMTLPDMIHSPEETINVRSGDCDDFAILASTMLTRIGIENRVLVIRFRALNIAHSICVWKDRSGCYNFMSDRELYRTGKTTIEDAVRKFYPDYETITSVDTKEYVKGGNATGSFPPKPYHGSHLMASLDPRTSAGL